MVMNWKMNPLTEAQAKTLLTATKKFLPGAIIAVPMLFLAEAAKRKTKSICIAAQDGHWEDSGAHTGDVSMAQIRAAGATYAIVGHAERRAAGDSNEVVGEKVGAAIEQGLIAIACVGESVRDEQGEYLLHIQAQLAPILAATQKSKRAKLIIAYEPVWAIGAPEPMRPHDMHQMTLFIKKILIEHFGASGRSVPVLYGGAVTPENVHEMMEGGEVDGFLVGRASIDPAQIKAFGAAIKTL